MRASVRSLILQEPTFFDADFARGIYQRDGSTTGRVQDVPGYSFTRASEGYGETAGGVLIPFASGVPRVVPGRGVLIEGSRVNSVRYTDFTGVVPGVIFGGGTLPTNWGIAGGSLAGLTGTINGTGTEGGLAYIEFRFNGTSSGTSIVIQTETSTGVPASSGQVWTSSIYGRMVGATTGLTGWYAQNLIIGGAGSADGSTQAPSETRVRSTATATAGSGATASRPVVKFEFPNGAAVDFTVRLYAPQDELGSFATSPIITTGSSATRAADVLTFSDLSVPQTGTAFAAIIPQNVIASVKGVFSYNSGSTANRLDIRLNGASSLGSVGGAGGVVQWNIVAAPTFSVGVLAKVAVAFAPSAQALLGNGGAATKATGATIPTTTQLQVGNLDGGTSSPFNGYISRITLYPFAMSDAQLQAVTA